LISEDYNSRPAKIKIPGFNLLAKLSNFLIQGDLDDYRSAGEEVIQAHAVGKINGFRSLQSGNG
jgi:hypothetical protein